jgi:hypothetical protein
MTQFAKRSEGGVCSLASRIGANHEQDFIGDVAGALRPGEKNLDGSNFVGLRGTFQDSVGAKLGDIFGRFVVQTGPGAPALTRMPRAVRCMVRYAGLSC